jgi:hypothetical protein
MRASIRITTDNAINATRSQPTHFTVARARLVEPAQKNVSAWVALHAGQRQSTSTMP